MSACDPGRPRSTGPETLGQLVLSPTVALAPAGEAASFAFSAAAAVAFSAPAGLGFAAVVGAVADFGAAGAPAFGGAAVALVGFDAGALDSIVGIDAGSVAADVAAAVGFDAGAFAAAAVPDCGFAAVPAFGFDVVAGFAAAGFDAVPAFGFAAVAAVDFAFGLRALEPASRARCVRVVVGAEAPVLVPPARGVGAGLSVVVSGLSSWSRRKRPVVSETTLRPAPTTPVMRSLGLIAMALTVGRRCRVAARKSGRAR
jgi:hypothetical protein